MKTSSCQLEQMSLKLKLFAIALVCLLAAPSAFSQPAEEEPRKKSRFRQMMEGPQMVLPDSLKSDVVVLEATRIRTFRRPLEFLPYHVSHLKRGLSWEEIWNLFDARVDAATDPRSFSFTLSEDKAEKWQVACRWTGSPRTVSIAGSDIFSAHFISHQCRLSPVGNDDQRWSLEVETSGLADVASKALQSAGRLTDGKVVYEVSPSFAKQGILGVVPLAGYLFTLDQEPVAAATAIPGNQRLIFHHSVASEDRSLLAAAACALMLVPENNIP